jgi:hypothetical protein
MKVKTNLKSGNIITNASNQAKSLTTQTVDLAKGAWKSAANQASGLWTTVTRMI